MITVHEQQGPNNAYTMWSGTTEGETFDRFHLKLPGSQEEIIKVCVADLCYAHMGSLVPARVLRSG